MYIQNLSGTGNAKPLQLVLSRSYLHATSKRTLKNPWYCSKRVQGTEFLEDLHREPRRSWGESLKILPYKFQRSSRIFHTLSKILEVTVLQWYLRYLRRSLMSLQRSSKILVQDDRSCAGSKNLKDPWQDLIKNDKDYCHVGSWVGSCVIL